MIRAGVIAVVLAAIAAPASVAHAQPADALGQPLPNPKLETGTITVRVIDGSVTAVVSGADVTLTVNDTPRTARTDASGRATFAGVAPGSKVQAEIKDAQNQKLTSAMFPVPSAGGVSVMLSRKPFKGAESMGGGPAAGGMPEPRAMSGRPRPDRNDPAGTITVRVTYNELIADPTGGIKDPAPPVGAPVALVGYGADDKVTFKSVPVDANGVAQFTGLDQTASVAYYALSQLPRSSGTDRLIAAPVQLDSQSGVRMILSGEKRTSTAAPIDDYVKLLPSDAPAPPAGKVRVVLVGAGAGAGTAVSLVDAATGKPVAVIPAQAMPADMAQAQADVQFENNDKFPKGALGVLVRGGPAPANKPLAGIEIKLAQGPDQPPIEGAVSTTNDQGMARVLTTAPGEVLAVVSMNGKVLATKPVKLASTGGMMAVLIQWPAGAPEVMFDVAHTPGQVLYAQTTGAKATYRSLPFQTAPEAGTNTTVYAIERTGLEFRLRGLPEDEFFGVQGTWRILNNSWAPFRASPDGYLIPLPPRHLGGVLAEEAKELVTIEEGQGFRIAKPIPPLGFQFLGKFSLPVDHGTVTMRMDLPHGAKNSELGILKTPEMSVTLPAGVANELRQMPSGDTWQVIPDIEVAPGKSISLSIAGLPAEAAWRSIARIAVGVIVIVVLLGGVIFAMVRKQSVKDVVAERRAKLLDELVDLEDAGKGGKRKEQLIAELEKIWSV
ncbi:MAG: carboxypeptidase-like regulatory domain-containing protein [Kofleriaceae bacterium]